MYIYISQKGSIGNAYVGNGYLIHPHVQLVSSHHRVWEPVELCRMCLLYMQ